MRMQKRSLEIEDLLGSQHEGSHLGTSYLPRLPNQAQNLKILAPTVHSWGRNSNLYQVGMTLQPVHLGHAKHFNSFQLIMIREGTPKLQVGHINSNPEAYEDVPKY